ncbi:MAG: hypothetical protein EOO38_32365 [Cytophagaceae bacterium]|nr:MAG: hypothetical protein EOO38_32365 [Cytophagaceae bacterium]
MIICNQNVLRHHIIFYSNRNSTASVAAELDEVEEWLQDTLDEGTYYYHRYNSSSSIYVFDMNDAFSIKMRWHEIISY